MNIRMIVRVRVSRLCWTDEHDSNVVGKKARRKDEEDHLIIPTGAKLMFAYEQIKNQTRATVFISLCYWRGCVCVCDEPPKWSSVFFFAEGECVLSTSWSFSLVHSSPRLYPDIRVTMDPEPIPGTLRAWGRSVVLSHSLTFRGILFNPECCHSWAWNG